MNAPRISEAEWEVMEVLWMRHPQTAQEVVVVLQENHSWKDQTIRTMLSRLVKKGAVNYRVVGKSYYYSPAVKRERSARMESRSFIQRVLRRAAVPVLVQMVRETELSRDDILELKRILTEKERRS